MKTKNENQFNGHHFYMAGFKKANVIIFITVLLLTFCSVPMLAQDQSESYRIVETKSFLSNLHSKEQASRAAYSNAKHIEDLLTKVQPSIYFNAGVVKTYGEKPVCLFTNVQSISRLNDTEMLKNNIEMIKLSIETATDLNTMIDLSQFSAFKNLKYIQIISGIPATEQAITNMVRNHDGKYSIFYKIKTGDSEQ